MKELFDEYNQYLSDKVNADIRAAVEAMRSEAANCCYEAEKAVEAAAMYHLSNKVNVDARAAADAVIEAMRSEAANCCYEAEKAVEAAAKYLDRK